MRPDLSVGNGKASPNCALLPLRDCNTSLLKGAAAAIKPAHATVVGGIGCTVHRLFHAVGEAGGRVTSSGVRVHVLASPRVGCIGNRVVDYRDTLTGVVHRAVPARACGRTECAISHERDVAHGS